MFTQICIAHMPILCIKCHTSCIKGYACILSSGEMSAGNTGAGNTGAVIE